MVLVTYDVNTTSVGGCKRLRQVAKECEAYGQRVQNSVFECVLDAAQCRLLEATLCEIIDEKADSLRFYFLGNNYKTKLKCFGTSQGYEAEGVLMF